MERRLLDGDLDDRRAFRRERARGQWLAGAVAICGLIAASIMVCTGHPWSGATVGSGGLATLVGLFVGGKFIDKKLERDESSREADAAGRVSAQGPSHLKHSAEQMEIEQTQSQPIRA
jgi:hypothetical protein